MSTDAPRLDEAPEKTGGRPVEPPPTALNVALALCGLAASAALLSFASHAGTTAARLACAVAFSFVALPVYSLLHEAEHSVFAASQRLNDAMGLLLGAVFFAPFSFVRATHLGHHRRNRSEVERFEQCYPDENLWRHRAGFYGMYLGGFWLALPLATLALVVAPWVLQRSFVQDAPSAAAMVNGVPTWWQRRTRLDAAFVLAFQAAWVVALDLNVGWWALSYALVALNWSSQQYITHAYSPRDPLDGAHNLRAARPWELFLLHFNWHLAHHQHPRVPWLYLPRYDDTARQRPGYVWSFITFWRGPVVVERPAVLPGGPVAGAAE